MKDVKLPEPADTEWLLKFYYLVDMTKQLNQLNVKMQGIGNTVLSLQQIVFAFENRLEIFTIDIQTGRLLHFVKLKEFKDVRTSSDSAQHFDLQQLAGFTFNLLQSFKARFGYFRDHKNLFKFITHPHECAEDKVNLSFIPDVRDFDVEVVDMKTSDIWLNKIKSLNEDLKRASRTGK